MIKAIIFDCFGVLTSDKWKEYVLSLPDKIWDGVHELNHQRSKGSITKEEFISKLAKVTGRPEEEILNITTPGDNKNHELLKYIKELKSQKYTIGLLSNVGSNWIREQFLTNDEQKLFDDILLSYEVNMLKPEPNIYHMAAERLGVPINECLLVDDIDSYAQAARIEGMQAIVYQNFPQMKKELQVLLADNR